MTLSAAGYLSRFEWGLWLISCALILASSLLFDPGNHLTMWASLLGATSLIFIAKGNPIGQVLIIIFGIMYAIISYGEHYYGEVFTYLGMTAPMALIAHVAWLRNPHGNRKSEVRVNSIGRADLIALAVLTPVVTIGFYFVLALLGTAELLWSTFSVTTSFIGAYLTARRSPYYALGYAFNDAVLIVLWIMASLADPANIPVAVLFGVFLVNDAYGFLNWRTMGKRQAVNAQ